MLATFASRKPRPLQTAALDTWLLPMWVSSMCTMSSARESKWSPQPPNLQALEKKEAAAMPVMVAAALEYRAGSGGGSGGGQQGNSSQAAVRTAGAAGAVRRRPR